MEHGFQGILKFTMSLMIVIYLCLFAVITSQAQENQAESNQVAIDIGTPPTSEASQEGASINNDGRRGYFTYKTPYEFFLVIVSIAALFATLVLLTVMGWSAGITTDFTRTFVIITIIWAALILIAAGYSDEQAAPVYGLLGTMLGYLFGKFDSDKESKAINDTEEPDASSTTASLQVETASEPEVQRTSPSDAPAQATVPLGSSEPSYPRMPG